MYDGIKLSTGCYNNGLYGERRMVFFCEDYFLLPSGMDRKDGTYVLLVGTGSHVSMGSLKFAGQYRDRAGLTMAMLMMLGSNELRHEYGAFVSSNDLVSSLCLRNGFTKAGFSIDLSFA